jgi:hypothetical protein
MNQAEAAKKLLAQVGEMLDRWQQDQEAERLQMKLWDDGPELFDLTKSHWMKSCPECSRKAGRVVFLPYPEAFGESEKRETQQHKGAQSWCTKCRHRGREHDPRRIQEA